MFSTETNFSTLQSSLFVMAFTGLQDLIVIDQTIASVISKSKKKKAINFELNDNSILQYINFQAAVRVKDFIGTVTFPKWLVFN